MQAEAADHERAKHRLIRYLILREAASNGLMTGGLDQALRNGILEAAKLVALSACIMHSEDPICAAELAHAAWSVIFIPGLVLQSAKEVEQVSAILDLANGTLGRGTEREWSVLMKRWI